uniref:Uncharacterized protein n=1 Tax=viral metagenome TaxID=1070528 RepID=A0A6H1ZSW8_9ZZZZ
MKNVDKDSYIELGQKFIHNKYGDLILVYSGACYSEKRSASIVSYSGYNAGRILVGPFNIDATTYIKYSIIKLEIERRNLDVNDFELVK